ncbi:MFS transporter, partial [Vibrio jasicida]
SRIIFASFIGTAIEFYDFYVYATAAALVIGPVFFPHGSATAQALSAFVTFGIAFIARPIGSFLFGHFGDRIGRKSTLVASLLVMGISTTLIGL